MANSPIAIVSGASAEEFVHLQKCLPDWQRQIAPPNDADTTLSWFPSTVELIVVYAQKEQRQTQAVCEQFRNSPISSAVPILLVLGRYEIPQANVVRCMDNATFIITPFNEGELQDKIVELQGGVGS